MNVTRIAAALVAVGLVAGSTMAQTAAPAAAPAAAPKAEAAKNDAYLKKGSIVYGGSVAYSSVNVDQRTTSTSGNVSLLGGVAEVNYFVIDNLSVGLAGNLDWLRGDLNGAGVANATLVYGDLVARYHFPLCNDKIIPYVGASVGAGYGMYSGTPDVGEKAYGDGTMTDWGVQGGFLVPLNANVMLDTCLKYTKFQLPGGWHTSLDATQVMLGFKMKY